MKKSAKINIIYCFNCVQKYWLAFRVFKDDLVDVNHYYFDFKINLFYLGYSCKSNK